MRVPAVRFAGRDPGRQPRLPLFRLFGIQFTANWSWLLLIGMLVYVAASIFRELHLGWSAAQVWSLSVVAAVLSVLSLYGHELAHALVARHFGIPVRTISLFLLGGRAHMTRESPSPGAEFLIALAGPVVSLAIGLAGAGLSWGLWASLPAVADLGLWLATMNLPLAVFNLVPAYPLDGGRVLRAVLWFAGQDARWGSALAARVGQVAALGLLVAGVYALVDGTAAALSGLWLIMIAWFLYAGATSAQAASSVMEALRRLTVASVMDRNVGRVDASLSVQAFAEAQLLDRRPEPAPQGFGVYRDDQLVGLMSLRQLGRIPASAWPHTRVERAMQPIELAPALEPGAPALGALHLIVDEGCDQVAVMAEGRLLGVVTGADLAKATR